MAKVWANAFECGFGGEAVLRAERFDLAVLDELVRPADADDRGFDSLLREAFEDCGAEAAGEDVVLEGDEQ